MRKSNSPKFLTTNGNKKVVGIDLSADYCAEHEWGIDGIRRALKIELNEQVLGPARHTIREIKNIRFGTLSWSNFDTDPNAIPVAYLGGGSEVVRLPANATLEQIDKSFWDLHAKHLSRKEPDIRACWDGDSFFFICTGEKNIAWLTKIYKAIEDGNAALWLGGGGLFENAGLVIAIINKLPDEVVKKMTDLHLRKQKAAALEAKVEQETHLRQLLKENGKTYHALRAELSDWAVPKRGSKYPLQYWLNPEQQRKYVANWYTVEELLQWVHDEGVVVRGHQSATGSSRGERSSQSIRTRL